MGLKYNQNIFSECRDLAVTDPFEIEVGKTYYSNCFPKEFTVVELLTERTQRLRSLGEWNEMCDNEIPRWVKTADVQLFSLWDRNCGNSYNPWLLFKNKQDRDSCENTLEVEFAKDDLYNSRFLNWV